MMIIAGSLDRPAEIARSGTPTGASARKVAEARLLSGLTWDELARAMSASRRSLHFWANGRPIGAPNEERLARLLAALRMTDRGTGTANRAAIIGPDAAGRVPLDLLAAGLFEEFKASLGPGRGRARSTIPVSAAAHAERAPLPPAAYLGALQDPVPTEPMPLVRGRLLRRQKRSA
jgi:transcriptional regulator with XRE-family HTH domain